MKSKMGKKLWNYGVFLWLVTFSMIAEGAIIPDARRIQWDPGVRGGIPNRTTVFANVRNAPYNARGDGVADDTAALQNAINACPAGQVVFLPAGTYRVTRSVRIKSGVILRGEGIGRSIIRSSSGFGDNWVIGFENANWGYDFSGAAARNLVAPFVKNGNTITTSVAHGWSVGDVVLIDELENAAGDPPVTNDGNSGGCSWCGRQSGNRPVGQWSRIVAVPTSTTAQIDPPLHWTYTAARAPQGVEALSVTENAGMEQLTVDNSVGAARDTIAFHFAVNCWALRVEMKGSYRRMVDMYGALWCTIKACVIHDGIPATPTVGSQYGSNRGYGVFMGPWPTACLVEDNQLFALSLAVSLEGAPSGNVIAYNFFTNLYYVNLDWQRNAIGCHGAHPKMNLIEGNFVPALLSADWYWGSSSHQTYFRNRQFNLQRLYGSWGVDLYKGSWYNNVVGNVLGTDYENRYELTGDFAYEADKSIYRLGFLNGGDSGAAGNDAGVRNTLLRHGNWDSVNNTIMWDSTIADRNIPASLYQSAKPTWFGNRPWPPFDPANPAAASSTNLPAGYRYAFGADPPPGGPVNNPPSATIGANQTSGVPPLRVNFTCTASDAESADLTFNWNFGDGTASIEQNPTKTYTTEGTYVAFVNVSDGTNSTRSSDITILVGNQAPIVAATVLPLSGRPPLTVNFSSAGSSDPEGAMLTYSWSFGDGATSAHANPSHVYQSEGTFNARLTVSDGVKSATFTNLSINVRDAVPGLVAAYSFDQGTGTTVNDDSGNGNNGALTGAIWVQGKYGQALNFNGASDVVTINSSATLNVGSAMTLEAWVYPTANQSGWRSILHREPDAYYLHASNPGGALLAAGGGTFVGAGEIYQGAASPLPLNTWTHLATTYDGATLRLYVNGSQVGSRAVSGQIQNTSTALRLGGNTYAGQFFLGQIDEVRIYNRALSISEVQADMNTSVLNRPATPSGFRFLGE